MNHSIWNESDSSLISNEDLFARLSQTIEWCGNLIKKNDFKLSNHFNKIELNPFHSGFCSYVFELGIIRQSKVNKNLSDYGVKEPDLLNGRLMVLFPNANTFMGSAVQISNGFFDNYNTPPSDTWVGYFNDNSSNKNPFDEYLLSYVPSLLIRQVNDSIVEETEECIQWLSDTDVDIRERFSQI